ncbi:hypothetical protein T03_10941 [Trichinella britovi]|uniref:Uncharacterized protein n=1 Tax=Trichinella britovi TaxID=45882 RepID=A0A0V1DI12_TRIBR|nr:hypothetical protein T03_10941 [Trichinella britovi]
MKRADAVLNQVYSLAINYHKAQTNVEMSCQAAYPLEQPLTIIMSSLRTLICDALDTSDAEDEEVEGCSAIIVRFLSF